MHRIFSGRSGEFIFVLWVVIGFFFGAGIISALLIKDGSSHKTNKIHRKTLNRINFLIKCYETAEYFTFQYVPLHADFCSLKCS